MLSILIVNWNGMRYIQACLLSIQAQMTGSYEVVVVDNGSTDGSDLLIEKEFPWVRLVRSPENLGFGRGNNLAARVASGDVFLLFNYDTELLLDVTPLAGVLRQHRELGCVGARMRNGAGVIVANAGRFPSPIRLMLFASLFWKPFRGPVGPPELGAQRVDWVEGSWLLIRRDTWEKVGGFDETIFMYGEDIDLCRCVENLGLFNAQIPKVFYKHYTGWSVHRLPMQYAAFRRFVQKHFHSIQWFCAQTVLYLGAYLRLFAYQLLWWTKRSQLAHDKVAALHEVLKQWRTTERVNRTQVPESAGQRTNP